MTVGAEVPYKRYVYTGTGDYTYDFKAYKDEDLILTYQDTSGLTKVLNLGIDYTVTRNSNDQGGTCHLSYSPTNGSLEIRRAIPIEQQTDWVNNNPLNVKLLEMDLDRVVMMIQQLEVDLNQGLQVSSWRGNWANNTLYYVNDNVVDPATENVYVAKEKHTSNSSGTISDDIALGYWALALDVSNIKDAEQNAADSAAAAAESEDNANAAATTATAAAQSAESDAADAKQSADNAEYWASQVAQSLSTVPVGHIMAWTGGYFTNASNGGYTDVLGDPETYLSPFGYVICDGREFQHASSPIFNAAGRHVPNLTDERFLMGSTTQGSSGGSNSIDSSHVHTTADHTLTINEMPHHRHNVGRDVWYPTSTMRMSGGDYGADFGSFNTGYAGGGEAHNHGDTGSAGGVTENRPKYLSVIFAMKALYGAGPDINVFLVQSE